MRNLIKIKTAQTGAFYFYADLSCEAELTKVLSIVGDAAKIHITVYKAGVNMKDLSTNKDGLIKAEHLFSR